MKMVELQEWMEGEKFALLCTPGREEGLVNFHLYACIWQYTITGLPREVLGQQIAELVRTYEALPK